jgi:hypothetical protein
MMEKPAAQAKNRSKSKSTALTLTWAATCDKLQMPHLTTPNS